MRAVKNAIQQSNRELEDQQKKEIEQQAHKEKHAGPEADQRVSYVRGLLDKMEPDG